MGQIPLDLPLPNRLGADDFLVSPSNEDAFSKLRRWPEWPDPVALLVGPEGSGKTHLGAIWAARAGARTFAGAALASHQPQALVQGPCLIEDADRVGEGEPTLFHVLNLARERGVSILLTAARAPNAWGLRTADLLSRLRITPLLTLGAPDDALVQAVLVKLFADRQVTVDHTVVAYLARRLERSIDAARRLVAAIDAKSLSVGGRITRTVAADVLASFDS